MSTFFAKSGHLQEVPNIWLGNIWYFEKLVTEEWWSQVEIRLYVDICVVSFVPLPPFKLKYGQHQPVTRECFPFDTRIFFILNLCIVLFDNVWHLAFFITPCSSITHTSSSTRGVQWGTPRHNTIQSKQLWLSEGCIPPPIAKHAVTWGSYSRSFWHREKESRK